MRLERGGLALLAAVALTTTGTGCRGRLTSRSRRAPALVQPESYANQLDGGRPSIADVAAQVMPSVVNVFSEHEVVATADDAVLGTRHHAVSLGSGVIVSSDGLIVTNEHVVTAAERIAVVLENGRVLRARVVGSDQRSDIAVLRVEAKGLQAIGFADASRTRVGDLVLAIGNPFGIGQTVTMGIISATSRANLGITDVEDFIQTDAAINPGNSGGALVDMSGRLVGINTAIASRTGGYQGVGFAIPSNIVQRVADEIARTGSVTRGWLGAAIEDVPGELAARLNLPPHGGVLITDVTADGPAARAGLARGDVIVAIDGTPTIDAAHLRNAVDLAGPARVHVELRRGQHALVRDVQLARAP
jgi:serine protease DegQ